MPFAKAVLTRRRRPGPTEGSTGSQAACIPSRTPGGQSEDLKDADQLFHDELVAIGRQLSTLVLLAGQVFDELCAEYRLTGDRTDRLANRINDLSAKVDQLDAKATEIPEATISSVVSLARHFDADYSYHGLAIFDPGNRPLTVQALYEAASPTPVGHLRECDTYRTDELRGAQLFSRTPVALNKWIDDLFSIGKARQKLPFPPKRRSIRPVQFGLEARSLPNILQRGTERGSDEAENDLRTLGSSQDVFAEVEETLTPSFANDLHLSLVLLVNVDVSGASFSQLCKLHAPALAYEVPVPDDSFSPASLRRRETILTRPKTITGISDLVFREIDINPPAVKHSRSTKFRNSPRNPLNKTMSQTLEIYAPKERRTPKDVKRRTRCFDDQDESRSCGSWRHSLKSVFRLSRSKSRDLWNVASSAAEEAARRKSDADPLFTLKRSMSLPRSLKSSTKHSTVSFASFRSSSVEGRLNFRVYQPEQSTDSSASKSVKPVAGERLGRALTKSLSQVRIGWPSRSRKNFDVPGRPQSMEIRLPSLDEDGRRPLLSFYNMSASNVLASTTTVTSSGGISELHHPWAKSLSIIKLRQNENKDQKDDCQSSSGRWSGSSGLTEKQVILEMDNKQPTSLGSTTLIGGQCPSEGSVNVKDSGMCLVYSPSDSSFPPLDKTHPTNIMRAPGHKPEKLPTGVGGGNGEEGGAALTNKNNFVVDSRPSRRSFISSNSLTRALSVGRKKTTQPTGCQSGDKVNEINSGHSQCTDAIDDEDYFPQKPSADEIAFRRSVKSSDSSKPKSVSRSSFVLKLKKLGKSLKVETPVKVETRSTSVAHPVTAMTMGDFISQASNETERSLTPSLPPGESNELKKLGELADRLAAAKAKASCAGALSSSSLSSSSSSGSCQSACKAPQSLVIGEVNRMLQRSAFSVLPSSSVDRSNCSPTEKSPGHFSFQSVSHLSSPEGQLSEVGSTPDDPPVSPAKTEQQRGNTKVQKTTELESILETSHEFEATPPYLIRSKMATAARAHGKQLNTTEADSQSDLSSVNDYEVTNSRTKSAFRKTNQPEDRGQTVENADLSDGKNKVKLLSSDLPISLSSSLADTAETGSNSPVPATARLIISSPLASRACFIENPFKRSLCQPLSAEEFANLCTGDVEVLESPSPNSGHFVYPEATKTSLDVFKHSAGFPIMIRERVDPSNYGRSWYDGLPCDHRSPAEVAGKPGKTPGSSYPSFAINGRLPNPDIKSTQDHMTGSVGFQSPNPFVFRKPEDSFQKPCPSFSASSPSKYDAPHNSSVNQSIGSKKLVTTVTNSQAGLGKKCARVVFPSSNSGFPPNPSSQPTAVISASKPNRTTHQGDQKPRTTVNLFHLKTFYGTDESNILVHCDGGTALNSGVARSSLFVPNAAQVVKSNTLPRSHLTTFSENSVPSMASHRPNLKCTSSVKY